MKTKELKKVLLCSYACSPNKGSEEAVGWNWSIGLARLGYEVWSLTNVQDKSATLIEKEKLNLPNLHFVFVELDYNLDKRLLHASSLKIYFHYLLWRKKAAEVSKKMHSEIGFDIAHHVSYGSLQQGSFLWKLKNTKFIFGPVGGGQEASELFREYFGKNWKIERIRRIISKLSFRFNRNLKMTLKNADIILVTNGDTFAQLRNQGYEEEKIFLVLDNAVPVSMELNEFINKSYAGPLRILWVGRLIPRKGLKLALHALSRLPPQIEYQFIIVGDGEEFQKTGSWIEEYKLDPRRLIFAGRVPFEEMAGYYRNADVFLFSSLRDSCACQLNEAMAFGLPIISLNIQGAMHAIPDNCGIKVAFSDVYQTLTGISDAILRFEQDRNCLRECAQNAFLYAKTNTWERKIELVTQSFYLP